MLLFELQNDQRSDVIDYFLLTKMAHHTSLSSYRHFGQTPNKQHHDYTNNHWGIKGTTIVFSFPINNFVLFLIYKWVELEMAAHLVSDYRQNLQKATLLMLDLKKRVNNGHYALTSLSCHLRGTGNGQWGRHTKITSCS